MTDGINKCTMEKMASTYNKWNFVILRFAETMYCIFLYLKYPNIIFINILLLVKNIITNSFLDFYFFDSKFFSGMRIKIC
jgi:hypothetical protein